MPSKISFGTDGWRAVIADDYTFDNLRICAQAFADALKQNGPERGCVIAYDNRFQSENFAAAAGEVLAANGIKAIVTDRGTPTPVLSFTILDRKAAGGIIVTASHNPATYNGFKVRRDYGGAADREYLTGLEQRIVEIQNGEQPKRMSQAEATAKGLFELYDAGPAYEEHVRNLVDTGAIRSTGLKIVHDAMYGVGAGWLERFAGGGATKIIGVNQQRNPGFPGINPEPIARNLGGMFEGVKRESADLGIATDGDADRLGVCDEHGVLIDQLRAISLLALYLLEVRGQRGPIVRTLSTSTMLDKLGEQFGVPVHEVGVGFTYVAPKMIETDAIIGGEESGGYAFKGHVPERDGIVAGLFIADMMVKLGKRPSELIEYLFSKVGPHFYDRIDTQFQADQRGAIIQRLQSSKLDTLVGEKVVRMMTVEGGGKIEGFKWLTDKGSWLLIRFSGTEPIMRIYTETGDQEKVRRVLETGKELAGV
jgi:alpha-D-glucose phosphate-specific phosphoglucomutase